MSFVNGYLGVIEWEADCCWVLCRLVWSLSRTSSWCL